MINKRTDKATEQRVIALYISGLTLRKAATEVGCAESTAWSILKRNGIPTRRREGKPASLQGVRVARQRKGAFIYHQCATCGEMGIPAMAPMEAWWILMERGWKIKANLNTYCPKHARHAKHG